MLLINFLHHVITKWIGEAPANNLGIFRKKINGLLFFQQNIYKADMNTYADKSIFI